MCAYYAINWQLIFILTWSNVVQKDERVRISETRAMRPTSILSHNPKTGFESFKSSIIADE